MEFLSLTFLLVFLTLFTCQLIFVITLDADTPSYDQRFNSSLIKPVSTILAPASQPQGVRLKPVWEVPPSGSKMPPLKTFRLTKELVQKRVKDNVVIVTFGNYAFMDFILTWVKHLTDLGLDNTLVG